jgi:TolB-like protein/Tfp pilus assembly protein PilF
MPGAVFLSYASQDVEAAKGVCDALRAAGCEVWFDQNELAGGDAWDAKIRGQIKACSLFMPLISANTNSRLEGYFRREWKHAVERTQDMDESLPFLVPVVIDGTNDSEARVPEKFRHVQWTKLPGGRTPAAFVERVGKLLGGEPIGAAPMTPVRPTPAPIPSGRKRAPSWIVPAVLGGILCAALAVWRPWRSTTAAAALPSPTPAPASAAVAPVPVGPAMAEPAPAPTVTGGPGRPTGRPASQNSVAVMAFANLSADKENEYFSDGISEDLINVLSKVPGLKVAARTSAFYFKGRQVPISEIARQLGVAFVVEGSVQKEGSHVRISAQLVNASDGFQVWSDNFDRELKDIFSLQDEIAGLLAKNLRLKMGDPSPSARAAVNPDAFQLFLAGRDRAERASTADLKAAIDLFQRAVALDPNYAAAWALMARANIQLARWGGVETSVGFAEARKDVDKAAALEPDSLAVLVALGWVRRTADWDWNGARTAFRQALELEPNNPAVLADFAILLSNIGHTAEGIQYARRAVELDPLNAETNLNLSILFLFAGELGKAEQASRRALQLAPDGQRYHGNLAVILALMGKLNEGRQEASLETDPVGQKAAYAYLAIERGQKERALSLAKQLEALAKDHPWFADIDVYQAEIYSLLNERDLAFAALGHAFDSHDVGIAWIKADSSLQNLHGDPRWPELLGKVGFSDEQLR